MRIVSLIFEPWVSCLCSLSVLAGPGERFCCRNAVVRLAKDFVVKVGYRLQ